MIDCVDDTTASLVTRTNYTTQPSTFIHEGQAGEMVIME